MAAVAFQGVGPWIKKVTTADLQRYAVHLREKKKRLRANGSVWQHSPERWWSYMHLGGVRKERFIIKPHNSRHQYKHFMQHWEEYDIQVMENPATYMGCIASYMYVQTWDCSLCHNSAYMDGTIRIFGKRMDKDMAIQLLEGWGVRFTVADPARAHGPDGFQYTKHRLYMHNFPYLADPLMNAKAGHGDADWDWKGSDRIGRTEPITYDNYGATTKTARNSFQSLWLEATEKFKEPVAENTTKAAAPKAEKKAEPKAEKKAKSAEPKAEKPKAEKKEPKKSA